MRRNHGKLVTGRDVSFWAITLGPDYSVFFLTFYATKLTARTWKMPSLADFMESLTQEQDKLVMMMLGILILPCPNFFIFLNQESCLNASSCRISQYDFPYCSMRTCSFLLCFSSSGSSSWNLVAPRDCFLSLFCSGGFLALFFLFESTLKYPPIRA